MKRPHEYNVVLSGSYKLYYLCNAENEDEAIEIATKELDDYLSDLDYEVWNTEVFFHE